MRLARGALAAFALLFLLPLALHAAWWLSREHPASWAVADWRSAGLLPPAEVAPEALVHVYAARAGRWKGVFAHHMWLVLKEPGAARYERFDKVGWGSPVRRDGWAPDARWYGNAPELVAAVHGPAAEALMPRLRAAIAAYPYAEFGAYRVWPGPNSNSFVAHVLAAAPELAAALPPTALGKDWRAGLFAGLAPSGSGVQLSLAGLFGVTLGWVEGIEVNVLGLVAGLDLRRPALKLPGFGRLGLAPEAWAGNAPATPEPAGKGESARRGRAPHMSGLERRRRTRENRSAASRCGKALPPARAAKWSSAKASARRADGFSPWLAPQVRGSGAPLRPSLPLARASAYNPRGVPAADDPDVPILLDSLPD